MGPQYPMFSKVIVARSLVTRVVQLGKNPSSFLDDNAIHRDGAVAARSNSASDISGMEKLGKKSELIVTYAIQSMNPYDPSWSGFMKSLASLYVLWGLKKKRLNTPANWVVEEREFELDEGTRKYEFSGRAATNPVVEAFSNTVFLLWKVHQMLLLNKLRWNSTFALQGWDQLTSRRSPVGRWPSMEVLGQLKIVYPVGSKSSWLKSPINMPRNRWLCTRSFYSLTGTVKFEKVPSHLTRDRICDRGSFHKWNWGRQKTWKRRIRRSHCLVSLQVKGCSQKVPLTKSFPCLRADKSYFLHYPPTTYFKMHYLFVKNNIPRKLSGWTYHPLQREV